MRPSSKASRRFARAARYAALSWLAFIVTMAVCIILVPRPLIRHLGLSYYGVDRVTLAPYLVGMLLSDYFVVKTAHALPTGSKSMRLLGEALIALAIVIVGVCLTPYTVDVLFRDAHYAASAVVFMMELGLAVWIAAVLCRRTILHMALLALQLAGAATAMVSTVKLADRIFIGEIVTQAAFGALVFSCLRQLARRR